MANLTFITGNPNKLRELKAVFPADVIIDYHTLDLEEIQGEADPRKIVEHKLQEAYQTLNRPVIVEDVSAGIESLHWLPGPFIKFFHKELGSDALYKLSKDPMTDRVRAICTMGYTDGEQTFIVEGTIYGRLSEPRGEGFGFDSVFVPDGYDQTLAELGQDIKNTLSHRRLAADALVDTLQQAGIC